MNRLSDRTLRLLAWAGWWLFVASLLAAGLLDVVQGTAVLSLRAVVESATFALVLGAFPASGVLVLRRQPHNAVGWLLLAVGLVWAVGGIGDVYATYGLEIDPGSLPLAAAGASLSNAIWAPALGVMATFLLLLFPDGRLPTRRWRPVAWTSGVVVGALTLTLLVTPDVLLEGPLAGEPNPLGIEALRPVGDYVLAGLLIALTVCIVTSASSLVVRFRRSRGVERQQLKWMTTAAAVMALTFLANMALSTPYSVPGAEGAEPPWLLVFNTVAFATWALMPAAIATAVLRHGLYDIDVVVNRALVYSALTVTLAATYLASVLLLQLVLRPATADSELAVAASTLAVAALFGPARRRIQTGVDRRFYRHRYDAALTLGEFTARLRDQVDVDAVGSDLVRVTEASVQPVFVKLWLVPGAPGPAPGHLR